jgi:FkbM family methyltransferase
MSDTMQVDCIHIGMPYNEVLPFRHGHAQQVIINKNDPFMYKSVSQYGEYSEDEVGIFREFVHPCDLVINAGANCGLHTLALAHYADRGIVYAMEPQRLAFMTLCGNMALNSYPHVMCMHVAVGRMNSTVRVPFLWPYLKQNTGGLVLDFTKKDGDLVEVIAIDDMGLPALGFMLIDVESMEEDVLLGAEKTIAAFKPAIYLEANWNQHGILSSLKRQGYEVWSHRPRANRPNNFLGKPVTGEEDDYGQVQFLALHPESEKYKKLTMGFGQLMGLDKMA